MHCQTTLDVSAASYLENYLDIVENLPDDVQRNISLMREFDVAYQEILCELESLEETLTKDLDSVSRKRIVLHVQHQLIKSQEIGDEKLQIVQQILDLIENKSRQLEVDYKNMGAKTGVGKDQENSEPVKSESQPERSSKRARRQRNDVAVIPIADAVAAERAPEVEKPIAAPSASASSSAKKTKKKKRKSKVEKDRDYSPVDPPVDPDEPTYCLCQQISYGEMIGCDNERCPIEWFHFSCVGLTTKPKGKWFCPKCRGDRPNVQKQTRS